MDTGKLPAAILARLLSEARTDSSVLIGPALGEDAAAMRFGGQVLIAAADPVTFTTDRIGHYAVNVNANDIAVMGGTPKWFLATVLLPQGSTEAEAESVFREVEQACGDAGVVLVGGHTEITDAVTRTVVSGCILGVATFDSLVPSGGARPGDHVVLVGGYAIEGTAILAREAADELRAKGVSEETIARAAAYIDSPGISIVEFARIAMEVGGVTAMHDPTEGGIATALRELAAASGHGIIVERTIVEQQLAPCAEICVALGLDALGLIASGCLLVTVTAEKSGALLEAYAHHGARAASVGTVAEGAEGVRFVDGAGLSAFDRDEIARYFEDRDKRLG